MSPVISRAKNGKFAPSKDKKSAPKEVPFLLLGARIPSYFWSTGASRARVRKSFLPGGNGRTLLTRADDGE